jgi:sporulation protein YlmC with PRC-barrel domain
MSSPADCHLQVDEPGENLVLQQATKLEGCRVLATDGEIGRVEEIYFDDERWVVRHLIVSCGRWLKGHEVLISPYAVTRVNPEEREVVVMLTTEDVRGSPSIEADRPVSRRFEAELFRYYGYPAYWHCPTSWAGGAIPILPTVLGNVPMERPDAQALEKEAREAEECHLRSSSEVTGYRIQARDGALGRLDDLIFDDMTWAIRFLVIDTNGWLPGGRVLVLPESIAEVDWARGRVRVAETRNSLRGEPPFDLVRLRREDRARVSRPRGQV